MYDLLQKIKRLCNKIDQINRKISLLEQQCRYKQGRARHRPRQKSAELALRASDNKLSRYNKKREALIRQLKQKTFSYGAKLFASLIDGGVLPQSYANYKLDAKYKSREKTFHVYFDRDDTRSFSHGHIVQKVGTKEVVYLRPASANKAQSYECSFYV